MTLDNWIWVKGSLHIHTANSDGDSSPQEVAEWYREHGYRFIAISDHGNMTDPTGLGSDGFVLITGEELDVRGAKKPIHGNAFGITASIDDAKNLATPAESIAGMVQRIRESGGIPQVNHPNFGWAFGHRELLSVKGPYLLEVFNGHPAVYNAGNCAFMPIEQTWDILLSNGKTVYATATDDAHHFKTIGAGAANPGRGWVYVHVPELTPEAILESLARGDLYPSTGVELADHAFDGKVLSVSINEKDGQTYLIRFIGKWGRILQETDGPTASYAITGDESYVRAKVICSDGTVAWTQAYRIQG